MTPQVFLPSMCKIGNDQHLQQKGHLQDDDLLLSPTLHLHLCLDWGTWQRHSNVAPLHRSRISQKSKSSNRSAVWKKSMLLLSSLCSSHSAQCLPSIKSLKQGMHWQTLTNRNNAAYWAFQPQLEQSQLLHRMHSGWVSAYNIKNVVAWHNHFPQTSQQVQWHLQSSVCIRHIAFVLQWNHHFRKVVLSNLRQTIHTSISSQSFWHSATEVSMLKWARTCVTDRICSLIMLVSTASKTLLPDVSALSHKHCEHKH